MNEHNRRALLIAGLHHNQGCAAGPGDRRELKGYA